MNGATTLLILAIAAAAVVLVGWLLEQRSKITEAERRESNWMPRELRTGRLLFSEPRPVFLDGDVPMVAKPDRAYVLESGDIKLVEFKTRNRHQIYPGDVIELSVQRAVLQGNNFGRVDDEAVVVTELRGGDAGRRVHRVRLLSSDQTMALARRYDEIKKGNVEPTKSATRRKCSSCGQYGRCKPFGS